MKVEDDFFGRWKFQGSKWETNKILGGCLVRRSDKPFREVYPILLQNSEKER